MHGHNTALCLSNVPIGQELRWQQNTRALAQRLGEALWEVKMQTELWFCVSIQFQCFY
jgi:hypothetical protein